MNALSTFNFNDTPTCSAGASTAIRVVTLNGDPWFVAADVICTLGVYIRSNGAPNTSAALLKLDKEERQTLPPTEANRIGFNGARGWGVALVSESGLYKLIMRSDKPQAKPFQDWVTKVVLPAIRKDGGYPPAPIEHGHDAMAVAAALDSLPPRHAPVANLYGGNASVPSRWN